MPVTIDGTNGINSPSVKLNGTDIRQLTHGTAQATTSGTSIDFTGIPSWAKRITVIFNGSGNTSGTSFLVQIGSGSVTTSGYSSLSIQATQTNAVLSTSVANGFIMYGSGAADVYTGHMVLTLVSGTTWVSSHTASRAGWLVSGAGSAPALGGALDRVRITSNTGTDAFDSGSINILYE